MHRDWQTLLALWTMSGLSSASNFYEFKSRPDLTHIPKVEVHTFLPFSTEELTANSTHHLFFAPHAEGPDAEDKNSAIIAKLTGEPVWIAKHEEPRYFDFHAIDFHGKPHLVYWAGEMQDGPLYGRTTEGRGVVLDQHYQEVAEAQSSNFYRRCHMHEMNVMSDGKALLLMQDVREQTYDGNTVKITDDYVQEVDMSTGEVLFDFSVADNLDVRDSYMPLPWNDRGLFHVDAFHANAASESEGRITLSLRHSHQVICIDKETRKLLWKLGGKNSDFTLEPASAHFRWQHDARLFRVDGQDYVTMFDNQNDPSTDHGNPSRGMVLHLDYENMVAKMVDVYQHPAIGTSASQGSFRSLDNGDVLVADGGSDGGYSHAAQFTKEGDIKFAWNWHMQSYRAYISEWQGTPLTRPDMVLEKDGSSTTVYVSWNGATHLSSWAVFGADDADSDLQIMSHAPHTWFETAIELSDLYPWIVAIALDDTQQPLSSTLLVSSSNQTDSLQRDFDLESTVKSALASQGLLKADSDDLRIYFGDQKVLSSSFTVSASVLAAAGLAAGGITYFVRRRRDRKRSASSGEYARVPLSPVPTPVV